MNAAILVIRKEKLGDGGIWFPLSSNKKTRNLYAAAASATAARESKSNHEGNDEAVAPFYLWDLVGISSEDFKRAYTSKPAAQLTKHHGASLTLRELSTADFVTVCSEDGKSPSATPDYPNIAVTGKDMKSLAAKVKTSLRSVHGSADMHADTDKSVKKRPAGGDGNDDGSRKKPRDSNYSEKDMQVKSFIDHRRNSNMPPTEMEQAYASVILQKMMKSNGTVTLSDGAGGVNEYALKRKAPEDGLPWSVGEAIGESAIQKRRKLFRMEMFSFCKGNLSEVASILNVSTLFQNFRMSKGIRGKPDLERILDNKMKNSTDTSTAVVDKAIVDNIKSFLELEVHGKNGDGDIGGSRPAGTQHYLNGLVCALSSQISSAQSAISSRLGLSQHSSEKGRNDRSEIEKCKGKELHKYCKPVERAERGDKYDDIAHQTIHGYCHDIRITAPDSNVGIKETKTVVLPSGAPAQHSPRIWLEKGDSKFQYQQFLKSEHYAKFQHRVITEKAAYYSNEKKPTICYESFCSKVCACVGDPTEMSCVDMTRDTLQLSLEGMEGYVLKNEDKLKDLLSNCNCADCQSSKNAWTDIFARREENSVNYLMKKTLCPREEQPSLTLDCDKHVFKVYKRECSHLECNNCGPAQRLQWNCPIFVDSDDSVEYWEWEKCETSGGEQNQMVRKTAKVKELMSSLREKIEDGIKHEFDKTWLNRTRHIDIKTFPKKTMAICTDFSAMLSLRPNRTKCAHVDRHAVLAIFYIITNPRDVQLGDGTTVRVTDCDVWHIFGNAENKDTKNDHVFHNACLEHIIKYYIEEKDLDVDTIRIWTDNCTGQYKCRQNFYRLSKIPLTENSIKIAEHCFAQVYSFKGPWDAAGKVIKWFIRRLERMEKARVEDAFQCYEHSTIYFSENLPSGNDWKKLEQELSNKLKDKSMYEAVERIAGHATDDEEEYNRLIGQGYKHIILTRRSEAEDTTVYDGSNDCHYFKGDGVVNENGIHLEMRSKPCRCNECRSDDGVCTYQTIRGEPKDFYRKEKAEMAAEKEQKKKDTAMAHVQQIEVVLANNSLLPLSGLTDAILKSLVFTMGIEVIRRDGQTNDQGKPLGPLKSDRLHFLGEANLTNESVQTKIDEIRAQFCENNAE